MFRQLTHTYWFHERATALYEHPQTTKTVSRRYKKEVHDRDISLYQVNEEAPSDVYFKNFLTSLLELSSKQPDILKQVRRHVGQGALAEIRIICFKRVRNMCANRLT